MGKALIILFRFPFWLISSIIMRPKYRMSLKPKSWMSQQEWTQYELKRRKQDKRHCREVGINPYD